MNKRPLIVQWLSSKIFYGGLILVSISLFGAVAYDYRQYLHTKDVIVIEAADSNAVQLSDSDMTEVVSHGLPMNDYVWRGLEIVPPDKWSEDDNVTVFPRPFVDLDTIQSYGMDYGEVETLIDSETAESAEEAEQILNEKFSTDKVKAEVDSELIEPDNEVISSEVIDAPAGDSTNDSGWHANVFVDDGSGSVTVKTDKDSKVPGSKDKVESTGSSDSTSTAVSRQISWSSISSMFGTDKIVGSLTVPKLGTTAKPIRWGAQSQINKGICMYELFDPLGVKNGTTMLAAHNYNPNWQIGKLSIGDRAYIETDYGKFIYEVYKTTINNEGRANYWFNLPYYGSNPNDLVFMTCYPFDSDGSNGQRYLVYLKKISGPSVSGKSAVRAMYPTFQQWMANS